MNQTQLSRAGEGPLLARGAPCRCSGGLGHVQQRYSKADGSRFLGCVVMPSGDQDNDILSLYAVKPCRPPITALSLFGGQQQQQQPVNHNVMVKALPG
jgi:hypothetical protein